MSKMKNMIFAFCLLTFAGISVNAVAGTSASPQDQVNNQTAIVKAVNQSDSIEADDLFTDAVIGTEVSVDDYNLILAQSGLRVPRRTLNRFPRCPRCATRGVRGNLVPNPSGRVLTNFTGCRKNGRLLSCNRMRS